MKATKYFGLFVVIMLAVAFAGCRKADRLTQFYLDYDTKVVLQSGSAINLPISLFTSDVETNSESEFAVHDTRKDKIQEIRLTSLVMAITSPSGQEFDFLKDVEIFLDADGLSETLIAHRYNIGNAVGATLTLDTENHDLKEYIKKDSFTLRVRVVTDESPVHDIEMNVNSVFFVDAKVIGKA